MSNNSDVAPSGVVWSDFPSRHRDDKLTLGIDSLQTLEMLSRLESHFGIELPDYEVQGVSDFRTLAERIQSRL